MKEEREVMILTSLWHRNRLVLHSRDIKEANDLFFNINYFIPQYRQLIFCGDIIKKARYLKGVKLIETEDLGSLGEAFKESLAEEELGTPPVQIVYFNAREETFKQVLQNLDRGWIATCTDDTANFVKNSYNIRKEIIFERCIIYMLDPLPNDFSIEEKLIEDTKESNRGIKQFIIQMKQSQVHLAFQAIQDELSSRKKVTQSYLSETLGIREKTLKKIIEIGIREKRLDISNYIEMIPSLIIDFLKEISFIKEVSLVAVFEGNNLVAYSRYRDIIFPTLNFLQLRDKIDIFLDSGLNIGEYWHLRLNSENKDIFIYNHDYLYCFILEKGINFITFRSKVEKLIRYI